MRPFKIYKPKFISTEQKCSRIHKYLVHQNILGKVLPLPGAVPALDV
jgi:hypothetical protein